MAKNPNAPHTPETIQAELDALNIEKTQADFPDIDVTFEFHRFSDYVLGNLNKQSYVKFNAAFRNWLRSNIANHWKQTPTQSFIATPEGVQRKEEERTATSILQEEETRRHALIKTENRRRKTQFDEQPPEIQIHMRVLALYRLLEGVPHFPEFYSSRMGAITILSEARVVLDHYLRTQATIEDYTPPLIGNHLQLEFNTYNRHMANDFLPKFNALSDVLWHQLKDAATMNLTHKIQEYPQLIDLNIHKRPLQRRMLVMLQNDYIPQNPNQAKAWAPPQAELELDDFLFS